MQSGKWPGNEVIGTHIIYSESEEAATPSASMLGMAMSSTLSMIQSSIWVRLLQILFSWKKRR